VRKRFDILIASACLAILAGAAWQLLSPHEPVYQGKRLSNWLEQFSTNHWGKFNSTEDKEAASAIRQIGTNALPVMLKLMSKRDSRLTQKLMDFLPRLWVSRRQDVLWGRRRLGATGFVALGPIARPAVPALMTLANDRDRGVRYHAVYALGHLGSAAQPAVPFLIGRLTDSSVTTRRHAMFGLAAIHLEPELVVPVMSEYASDHGADVVMRWAAIQGLGNFGAQAKAAIPVLVRLLSDQGETIRSVATNSLPMIDREAAVQASVERNAGTDHAPFEW
jgi:hypothetical protein